MIHRVLVAAVWFPVLAIAAGFEGTVTWSPEKPPGKTVIVFTGAEAKHRGCAAQRIGDLGLAPSKPGELTSIDILEPVPPVNELRFVATVDEKGRYRVHLPIVEYTATVEHRDSDVFSNDGDWRRSQSCRELKGTFRPRGQFLTPMNLDVGKLP